MCHACMYNIYNASANCNHFFVFPRFEVQALTFTFHMMVLYIYRVQALIRTLCVSGGLAALDALLKILYIFVFHVPLFLYGCGRLTLDPTLDPTYDRTITTHHPSIPHYCIVEDLLESLVPTVILWFTRVSCVADISPA